MKKLVLILVLLVVTNIAVAQGPSHQNVNSSYVLLNDFDAKPAVALGDFNFTIFDAGVNTKFTEYGSSFFMDKYIVISARKIGAIGGAKDKVTNEPYTELFCTDVDKYGNLSRPLLFSRIINTVNSEGSVTFTPDEKVIYYTRSSQENSMNYKLYRANLDEIQTGKWVNEELIPYSSDDYSIENPFISADGTKLYFASDMEGSLGGFDIFVAEIFPNGAIGEPVNLGADINTENDEKFPYISKDDKHLYFSSNGHNTLGGLDIFRAHKVFDTYKRPVNLGNTINSDSDDYAFILASENRGFFTSDRVDGKGRSDIYKFVMEDVKQTISGVVLDKDSRIPLPNAVIELIDEEGNVVDAKTTTEDAKFTFDVNPFEVYTIRSNKDGFENNEVSFTSDSGKSTNFDVTVEMDPTKAEIVEVEDKLMISIENIYFDFNKWMIKTESTISLNKIVDVLNANPEMKIEINAHTDARGRDAYNMTLSKKRAASAMKYLISKGINADRLMSNGYGETQPLFDCGTQCSDEEHELNRRIEFVIIN